MLCPYFVYAHKHLRQNFFLFLILSPPTPHHQNENEKGKTCKLLPQKYFLKFFSEKKRKRRENIIFLESRKIVVKENIIFTQIRL